MWEFFELIRSYLGKQKSKLHFAAGWLTAGLFLLLAVTVVLWGTEYKLSLYKTESTMQMPAKLCTRSSEAAKSQVHLAMQPAEVDVPLLETIAIGSDADHDSLAAARIEDIPVLSVPSFLREMPQVAFRPPPFLTCAEA